MAALTNRIPRLRHFRNVMQKNFGRRRRAAAWFDDRSVALDGTGTGTTFTVVPEGVPATGTLTLTDHPVDGETATIDGKVYTFKTVLAHGVDGQVQIASTFVITAASLAAALVLGPHISATAELFGSSTPAAGQTVTCDGITYTFESVPTEPNEVGRGGSASVAWRNLRDAMNGDPGNYGPGTDPQTNVVAVADGFALTVTANVSGPDGNGIAVSDTLSSGGWGGSETTGGAYRYSTSTTLHSSVTAVDGGSGTADFTAKVDGVVGNSIATTETLSNGSFSAATLLGGLEPDTILGVTGHGFEDGAGPFRVTNSGGALPGGLLVDTDYWLGILTDDTFQLFPTFQQAHDNAAQVDITSTGTGTSTITPATAAKSLLENVRQEDVTTDRLNTLTDIDDIT